ncbi:MAG: hypothetical protein COW76_01655 [Shewanella sp. CG18_big_fil_WC_8_21_14_2_50_42_11]|uniref:hypothetical protein n=1 Tax=Shewanella sp. CG18_big_fil_WC_8_21_14_2_50_42_11 TaxID=1975538 RepID=UPI000C3B968C|nr:hypothetical protein [Shewanella sp. CG18_big_fil_WC_8_21_14_2_50_42_11]PIQ02146.1 MAG: hypothetical protein COW76_01655 [Shewanella sp. CG18_big_fil_WC_8_21_14_2_50_42_11]
MDLQEQLTAEILTLEEQLLEVSPLMPQTLRKIHTELAKNPQLIQPLTDEQIAVITKGLQKYTETEIITAKEKKRKPSLKKVTLNDLL